MIDYNQELRFEACKRPRKITQEQCEASFNFTCVFGGYGFGHCLKFTLDADPKENTPDIIEPKRAENTTTSGISIRNNDLLPREDLHNGRCPEAHHEDEDPAGETKNCYCYPKPTKLDRPYYREIDNNTDAVVAACKEFNDFEYGFGEYASKTPFFAAVGRLLMLEYNRDFKDDRCKGPKKLTNELCVEEFKNATDGCKYGGWGFSGCVKFTDAHDPQKNTPDVYAERHAKQTEPWTDPQSSARAEHCARCRGPNCDAFCR